jgi:hypothetical protein
VPDLVTRDAPVIRVFVGQLLAYQRPFYVYGRSLQKLIEAVLEPDGPATSLLTFPVWVGHRDGEEPHLHATGSQDIDPGGHHNGR